GRQVARPRTGRRWGTGRRPRRGPPRRTGRRHKAPAPRGRTARSLAADRERTVPGPPVPVPDPALDRARRGPVRLARRRTDPARDPPAPGRARPGGIPPARAATAARARKHPVLAGAPARRPPSPVRTGRATAAPPRTGRPRPGLGRAGIPAAARLASLRGPIRVAVPPGAGPDGRVPAR